jgi:ABC-type transport system involved in multi-copper enzyme maturation permease subunit
VSPLHEIRHIVLRELRKNFRSIKGIALGVLTLLGGSSIALLIAKVEEFKREKLGALDADKIRELREEALKQVYEAETAKWLADAPEVLLGLLYFTVWLTPLLIALMGFDSISPDIQHRSVRYWTLRTRRTSYFIGKWAGLWATVSIVTFAMDLMVWLVCIARGEGTAAATLGWGFRFWVISLPLSAVWCGIATLISSLFRSPIIALLTTFGSFFVLWVLYLIGGFAHFEPLLYVYPNYYDHLMLDTKVHRLGIGLLASLGMAAAYVGAGSALFARRDV